MCTQRRSGRSMSLGLTDISKSHTIPGPLLLLAATCCGLLLGIVATKHASCPSLHAAELYEGSRDVHMPPLARRVFACISFQYDVRRLAYLKLTITTLRAYPTCVHICVITDSPRLLALALAVWNFKGVSLCPRDTSAARVDDFNIGKNVGKHFNTTWQYHAAFAQALAKGYSAYLLLEDDLALAWPAFRSWANDAENLEPLKFQRCFYRTEFAPKTGVAVMLEQRTQLNLTGYSRRVTLDIEAGKACMPSGRRGLQSYTQPETFFRMQNDLPASCQHSHFLQLKQPYQGMFAASHKKMLAFMNSSFWDPVKALSAKGHFLDMWHVPERANSVIQVVDLPRGWHSACLVPFFPAFGVLSPVAHIEHERVRYSLERESVPVQNLFRT